MLLFIYLFVCLNADRYALVEYGRERPRKRPVKDWASIAKKINFSRVSPTVPSTNQSNPISLPPPIPDQWNWRLQCNNISIQDL